MSKFDFPLFLSSIQKYNVVLAHIAPPILIAMANHSVVDNYNLSSLRYLVSGAAPMAVDVALRVQKRLGVSVKQGYGMTEMSPVSHTTPFDDRLTKLGSCGHLLPNMVAKVVEPQSGKGKSPPPLTLCRCCLLIRCRRC
jgi:acyl-CoA synthetase (AMP-forming)/AMP-acid ligase II